MIRIFYIAVFMLASLAGWGQQGMLLAVPEDGVTYLVDEYPPRVAYGMNKLSSTATNSVTIKRSSDGDTLVVGFSGDNFDAASASAFVGANDAWVQTWWDQSGNDIHFYQTDSTRMPLIYSSGALVTESSKASISFDGVSDAIRTEYDFAAGDLSIFFVAAPTSPNTQDASFFNLVNATASAYTVSIRGGGYGTRIQDGGGVTDLNGYDLTSESLAVVDVFFDATAITSAFYYNATARTDVNLNRGSNAGSAIGARYDYAFPCEIRTSVFVVYESDQTANRTDIETIINNYYSIY